VNDISGTQGFSKTGSGTLTFGGSYGLTGPISINGGKLSVSGTVNPLNGQGSSYAISNGATLEDRETGPTSSTSRTLSLGTGGGAVSVTNPGTNVTWNGAISGTGDLTKSGAGTLILSGANTYTGAININAGTLSGAAIDNSGTNSSFGSGSSFSIANGATLG